LSNTGKNTEHQALFLAIVLDDVHHHDSEEFVVDVVVGLATLWIGTLLFDYLALSTFLEAPLSIL